MKKNYFYKLKKSYEQLFVGNNLFVLLQLLNRKNESEIMKRQISEIISNESFLGVSEIIDNHFKERKDYQSASGIHKITNRYSGKTDYLKVHSDYLILESESDSSPFLHILSLFYPELVAVNYESQKIKKVGVAY